MSTHMIIITLIMLLLFSFFSVKYYKRPNKKKLPRKITNFIDFLYIYNNNNMKLHSKKNKERTRISIACVPLIHIIYYIIPLFCIFHACVCLFVTYLCTYMSLKPKKSGKKYMLDIIISHIWVALMRY